MDQAKDAGELGLAAIMVWIRFMATRQLIWNKNYNVKPRYVFMRSRIYLLRRGIEILNFVSSINGLHVKQKTVEIYFLPFVFVSSSNAFDNCC